MVRLALIGVLAAAMALSPVAATATATAASGSPAVQRTGVAGRPAPVFALFRGLRFGGSRRYGYSYGYRYPRRRHSLLHRAVKTAIWLYVLHLFFTHGGLSVLLWIVLIGLVLSLVRRRRGGYAYGPQSRRRW